MAKTEVAKSAISPRRAEDFPEWYQQVIRAADMAEPSDTDASITPRAYRTCRVAADLIPAFV